MKNLLLLILSLACFTASAARLTVTSNADTGVGTLRAQVAAAASGDTIDFNLPIGQRTITLTSASIQLPRSIHFAGPTAYEVIINQNIFQQFPAWSTRLFWTASGISMSMRNLTLEGGELNGSYSSPSKREGGGLAFRGDYLTMSNCTIRKNFCDYGISSGIGGGIGVYAEGFVAIFDSCVFDSNWAETTSQTTRYEGGAALFSSADSTVITNCTFVNNIFDRDPSASQPGFHVTAGGAVRLKGGGVYIDNCDFNHNSVDNNNSGAARGRGSAIFIDSTTGTTEIANCRFLGNRATGNHSGGTNGYGEATVYVASGFGDDVRIHHCEFDSSTSYSESNTFLTTGIVALASPGKDIYIYDNVFTNHYDTLINFTGNDGFGQAVFVYPYNSLMEGFYVYNNHFENCGGGVQTIGDFAESHIFNNSFVNNRGTDVASGGDSIRVYNNTFFDTIHTELPVFQYYNGDYFFLINNTIYDNQFWGMGRGTVHLKNNIAMQPPNLVTNDTLWKDSTATSLVTTCIDLGGNIFSDNSASLDFPAPSNQHNTNPLLDQFDFHGGTTRSFSLQAGSPAIDAGVADTLSTDQRGFYRDLNIDAGAHEDGATSLFVNPLSSFLPTCTGDSLYLGSSAGGTGPFTYQWLLNGSAIGGAGSSTYSLSSTSLADNGDYVLRVNNGVDTVYTDTVNVNAGSAAAPTISITVFPSDTICAGDAVTASSTNTNGGGSPAYDWQVNGITVATGLSSTLISGLVFGDTISCVMTSSLGCATPSTVTSNAIPMTVNPVVTPSISINTSGGTTICTGASTTINSSIANGGTTPAYQWYINGIVSGNSAGLTTSALTNGDSVYCDLTSNAVCPSSATVRSNVLIYTVQSNVTPNISINSVPFDTICEGDTALLTASIGGGGSAPQIDWFLNGSYAASGNTYGTPVLSNGDQVDAWMVSNSSCRTTDTGFSNTETYQIKNVGRGGALEFGPDTVACLGYDLQAPFDGTSFQWSDGSTAWFQRFISSSGTYALTMVDSFNCTYADTITITVVDDQTVEGTLSDSSNNALSGVEVLMYFYDWTDSSMHRLDSTLTDPSGFFSFSTDSTLVYLLAKDANAPAGLISTYYGNAAVIQNAWGVGMNQCDVYDATFAMLSTNTTPGSGQIGGNVVSGNGKAQNGAPVEDLRIVLIDSASGRVMGVASTDANGDFSFSNLPLGTYTVWVDQQFVDNTIAPNVELASGNEVRIDLEFELFVDRLELKVASGIAELGSAFGWSVFPNPADGRFKLKAPDTESFKLVVTDISGRMVMESESSGSTVIDLSALAAGSYTLLVTTKDGRHLSETLQVVR